MKKAPLRFWFHGPEVGDGDIDIFSLCLLSGIISREKD